MRVLIVDAMPIVYAQFAKVGHLSVQAGEHAGTPTGLRFGFLRTVRSYLERTKCVNAVIVWDTKAPIIKAQGLSDFYKQNRAREVTEGTNGTVDKQKMYDQIPDLKEMISYTLWTQVECDGYEADDLIGHYADKLSSQGHTVVISTTDNDLCQAVDDDKGISIFIPKSSKGEPKKDGYKDEAWVKRNFGVTGKQVPLLRALIGDRSDSLKGINDKPGVDLNIDLAQRIIATDRPTTPEAVLDAFASSDLTGATNLATELAGYMDDYAALVNIMTLHSPPEGEAKVTKGARDAEALTALFTKLEFASMMKYIPEMTA